MRKIILSVFFAVTFIVFTSVTSFAHAQMPPNNGGTPQIRTSKFVIPFSASTCADILRKMPQLASDTQGCNIVITSKTWSSSNTLQANVVHPNNSCPSQVVNHQVTYWGPLHLFHATLFTSFTFNSDCSNPTVSYENCKRDLEAILPYTGVTNTNCDKGTSGSSTFAEGDWSTGGVLIPTVSFFLQSIADPYSTNISDSW